MDDRDDDPPAVHDHIGAAHAGADERHVGRRLAVEARVDADCGDRQHIEQAEKEQDPRAGRAKLVLDEPRPDREHGTDNEEHES